MSPAQIGVRGRADCRVLRGDGTTTEKIAPSMLSRVIGDAFPEQAKNDQVAMLRMNTCPSQFNHLRAKRLEDLELELLRAIVAATPSRVVAGLQSVGANDIGGG